MRHIELGGKEVLFFYGGVLLEVPSMPSLHCGSHDPELIGHLPQ
jgi:hypothetical protein